MADKELPLSEGVIERFVQLRVEHFGPRGKGKFARMLGISQSTYCYYERDRVPPVEILVRASKVTGCSLAWLAGGGGTAFGADDKALELDSGQGSGDQQRQGSGAEGLDKQARQVVDRLVSVVGSSDKALEAVRALTELMERARGGQEQGSAPKADQQVEAGQEVKAAAESLAQLGSGEGQQGDWGAGDGKKILAAPVLGRVAAGIPMFWNNRQESQEFVDLMSLAYQAIDSRKCNVLWQGDSGEVSGVQLLQLPKPRPLGSVQVGEVVLLGQGVRLESEQLFAAWIDGDSMAPMLVTGDLVIVSPDIAAVDGKVAMVQLAGQIGGTCKIYRRAGNNVHLTPANDAYAGTIHPGDQVLWALKVLYRVALNK